MNLNKKLIVAVFFLVAIFIVASIGQSGNSLNINLDHKKKNTELLEKTNILENSYSIKDNPPAELVIDNIDPEGSALNWSEAYAQGICTGSGINSDPYIINGRTITDTDGEGGCLSIRDSNVYFIIQGCTFLNSIGFFECFGISLSNVENGTILKNQFLNNCKAISISFAKNITINENTINNNDIGLYIQSCSNITVINNNMNMCGIIVEDCSKSQMDSLYINKTNKVNGKPIFYYINNNTLNNDDFKNAGQVILSNCSNVIISSLNVSKVSRGISLYYSCKNITFSNITSSYQYEYGMYISTSCSNITIYNNTASFNGFSGIYLSGDNCNVTENILNYNKYSGISISSNNATVYKNTIKNNQYIGIELSNCGNATLKNNSIIQGGIKIEGSQLEKESHFIDKTNFVNGRYLYYYSKKNNLGNSNFSNAGQIIIISCENSTISNSNISNVYSGIAMYYCENITIFNYNISNNIRYGIYAEYTIKCNFTNNIANNISGTGFYFESNCSFNIIFNNVVNNNSANGIYMDSNCNNNTISENIININYDHGLQLSSNCNNNNITANEVNYNSKYLQSDCGIYIYKCNKNNISDNNVNYNYDSGIYINEGVNNTIYNNTLIENREYGIYLHKGEGNNVSKNTMIGCGLGINKYSSLVDIIKNNINSNNIVNGKPLYYYDNEIGLLSTSFQDAGQIFLINCSYSSISNGNVSYTSTGISLYYSHNNTINNINATLNIFYGIELYESKQNNITKCQFINNADTGIILDYDSTENQIYSNIFINNTVNANDDGLNNIWNNASIGNYWDDYTGCDSNNDGIGETPYNIPGNSEAKDYKPITTRKCTPIILVDDDDDDKKEEVTPVVVPFGNFYLVFVVLAIITILIRVKKRKINH